MNYNTTDRKQIREARRMARLEDRARQAAISSLMSTNLGRQYVYNLLSRCYIFSSPFNTNGLSMAFACGEQNVGLMLIADIMPICADQYILMQREANDRSIAADARSAASEPTDGDDDETSTSVNSGYSITRPEGDNG